MEISLERITTDLDYITSIEHPIIKDGCTRHSYSKEDLKAREYLLEEMEKLDLDISIDNLGNIRGLYKAKDDIPSIMIGSHIDTVTSGGKYDGLLGVLTSLEVIRTIKENSIDLKSPVELVIFAEEEGSNFGITMLGSKILTGKMKIDELHKIFKKEESAFDIIKNAGFDIDNKDYKILKKDDIKAMVELHIEQGAVLDTNGIEIGVVHTIAGMSTYEVTIEGVSNHAGTTPMNLRQDPVLCGAEVITELTNHVNNNNIDTTVVTIGKVETHPGSRNAIASTFVFSVDIRDIVQEGLDDTEKALYELVEKYSKKYNVKGYVELIAKSPIVKLSDKIVETIRTTAQDMEIKYLDMHSGAVHDAVMLTDIADVGMIFVPSVKGFSHSPEEYTKEESIKIGGNLLLNTVINLAN